VGGKTKKQERNVVSESIDDAELTNHLEQVDRSKFKGLRPPAAAPPKG